MKKNIRRLLMLVSCLLLCAIGAMCCVGCASTPPEDPELSAVKDAWNQLVVNREKPVSTIEVWTVVSSGSPDTSDQQIIQEILGICETLDLRSLQVGALSEEEETALFVRGIHVTIIPEDASVNLGFMLSQDGQASFHVYMGDEEYRAHITDWQVYESLSGYVYK